MATAIPFSGEAHSFGGATNINALIDECPMDYNDSKNVWRRVAEELSFFEITAPPECWKWKSGDPKEREHQSELIFGMLKSDLPMNHKLAIVGWMLFEALAEVPAM